VSLQLVVVEVEMGASLAEFQEAIRQKMGIMPEQQRIIVVGAPPPPPFNLRTTELLRI